jgi:hypothetical protein
MSRKLITLLTAVMSVVMLAAVAYAFKSSMNPSERSLNALPRVPIPKLEPSQFRFVHNPLAYENWSFDILFVRKGNGVIDAWEIPTMDGKVILPDLQWGRQGPLCNRLVPDFNAGTIYCEDARLSHWAKQNYRWNMDGKNMSHQGVADMMHVHGVEENGEYVLYKSK